MTGRMQSPIQTARESSSANDPRPPFRARVLQEDVCSRVERIETEQVAVVRKTHRPRLWLLWRTFLVRSRGAREYANLARLSDAGVRCVRPLAWSEARLLGCAPVSYLVTEYVDARNLRDVLALLPAGVRATSAARRALATRYGELARELHCAGFLSTTLQPRNVLVCGDPQDPHLRLCDQPALVVWPRSVHLSHLAAIDLYDMAFSSHRQRDFSRAERFRILRAYVAGDRTAARRIWRALSGRSSRVHRAYKQLTRGVFGRVLARHLRRRVVVR